MIAGTVGINVVVSREITVWYSDSSSFGWDVTLLASEQNVTFEKVGGTPETDVDCIRTVTQPKNFSHRSRVGYGSAGSYINSQEP